MKKYVQLAAVLSFVATHAYAQAATVDSEVEAELDQMYGTTQAPQGKPQGNQGGQPIYIMNQPAVQAQPQQQPVQKQPTTYIEASPLNKSRAEQMRESRQQVEAETETKIVEKLEQSRIEDEKKRANVLFGDKLDNMNQPQQPAVQAAPAPVVAPAPVEDKESTRDMIREELQMAMAADAPPPAPTSQKYFSASAGVANYPDARNVRGNYLLGAAFGNKYNNVYAVEGTFMASNYSVDKLDSNPVQIFDPSAPGGYYYAPQVIDVTQYSMSVAIKYFLLESMVRPVVGGLAQFSYRTFGAVDPYGGTTLGSATSQAIDMGLITGADIEVSPTMSLGVDFRYMFNLSSRTTTDNRSQYYRHPSYGTPIEKLQYYTLSFAAKVNF